jgi:hypothetical protein
MALRPVLRSGLLAALCATLAGGCADAPVANRPGPPVKLVAVDPAPFTAPAGTTLPTPLAVRVTDAQGRGVEGIEVLFTFLTAPAGAALVPARRFSDGQGVASTTLVLGFEPGSYQVTVTAAGIAQPLRLTGVGAAGPGAAIAVTPYHPRLRGAGDSLRLRATLVDQLGNPIPSGAITWSSGDTSAFSVDSLGWVRARRSGALGAIHVSAAEHRDSVRVVVNGPGVSPCFGGPAVTGMAVGEVRTLDTRAGICLPAGDASYMAVALHGTGVSSATATLSTYTGGIAPPPPPAPSVAPSVTVAGDAPARDAGFEAWLRARERRETAPLLPAARAVLEARGPAPAGAASRGIAAASIPEGVKVGDLLTFNGGTGFCSPVVARGARVMAVSARAVVVADTANPEGGFSEEDYQRYATQFDTLIAPVVEANFGTPHSIDAQPRAVMLFTRAVNSIASSPGTYVAGFYYQRDLLPKVQGAQSVCPGSNETEIFYLMVPDTAGVAGNKFTRQFVDSVTIGTIGHEYQHLINASRRMFVTRTDAAEEVWLNEGLSHVAEELLFYRSAGLAPGRRIAAASLGDPRVRDAYGWFMSPNLARLRSYLMGPELASPFASNDDIATRGAAWSFLRFAADQAIPTGDQHELWARLVNSATAGMANLQAALGRDPLALARDWAVATGVDGLVAGLPRALTQPSWELRSAWPQWRGPYPVRLRTPNEGGTLTISLRGTGAAYIPFSTVVGRESLLDFSSSGGPAVTAITVTLVRVR